LGAPSLVFRKKLGPFFFTFKASWMICPGVALVRYRADADLTESRVIQENFSQEEGPMTG
jgi:hypothetical protein